MIIPPDVTHEVETSGAPVLIGFIDRESDIAAALADTLQSTLVPIPPEVVTRWRRALGSSTLDAQQVEHWVRSELLNQVRPPRIDPRVGRVLRSLRTCPPSPKATTLPRLAQLAGLSPSRFMHLFTRTMGIPLRRYLLWLRVQRAVGALATGHTATEAAYLAGFADAAHLTRTFRRMLGASPRDLMRRTSNTRELRLETPGSQFVQDGATDPPVR